MTNGPSKDWEALFLSSPTRIIVTGANGAGKTRLAVELAQRFGLPILHNDRFALLDHWRVRPRDQSDLMRVRAAQAEAWVLEGGPSVLAPEILDRTEIVIWLDRPAMLRVFRIIKRSAQNIGRTRPEHPARNPDWPGLRQLRFISGAWRKRRWFKAVVAKRLEGADVAVIHLQRRRDIVQFKRAMRVPQQNP